jgi:Flp pilus assembly protein TadB
MNSMLVRVGIGAVAVLGSAAALFYAKRPSSKAPEEVTPAVATTKVNSAAQSAFGAKVKSVADAKPAAGRSWRKNLAWFIAGLLTMLLIVLFAAVLATLGSK